MNISRLAFLLLLKDWTSYVISRGNETCVLCNFYFSDKLYKVFLNLILWKKKKYFPLHRHLIFYILRQRDYIIKDESLTIFWLDVAFIFNFWPPLDGLLVMPLCFWIPSTFLFQISYFLQKNILFSSKSLKDVYNIILLFLQT